MGIFTVLSKLGLSFDLVAILLSFFYVIKDMEKKARMFAPGKKQFQPSIIFPGKAIRAVYPKALVVSTNVLLGSYMLVSVK
jgi:hypothetical protein